MPLFILTRDYSPIRLDSAGDSSLFFSVAATLKYLLRSEVHVYYMTTTTSRQFCIKVNLFHAKKKNQDACFSPRDYFPYLLCKYFAAISAALFENKTFARARAQCHIHYLRVHVLYTSPRTPARRK